MIFFDRQKEPPCLHKPCALSSSPIRDSPRRSLQLASLIGLGDFLVSDTDRVSMDVQRPGEAFFSGTHLRPVEIFV